MGITIEVNGIEVPYVKEDLKTKIPNNSFTDSFKVPHSSYPIRIVESQETQRAMGDFRLDGIKTRYFSCSINVNGSIQDAELEQISRIGKFRKCNISYKNPLTEVLDKRLSNYLFPENVLGEDPLENPYTETSNTTHGAFAAWVLEAANRKNFRFPAVFWQMATVRFKDYFTEDGAEPEYDYLNYNGFMNGRSLNQNLIENEYIATADEVEANNFNIYTPQVFVLSPIYKALKSIGYNLKGSWATSAYAQSLLFDSYNHNMTEVTIGVTGTIVDLTALTFEYDFLQIPELPLIFPIKTYYKVYEHTTTSEGEFKVRYKFKLPVNGSNATKCGFFAKWQGDFVEGFFTHSEPDQEGDLAFEVGAGDVGDVLEVYYHHFLGQNPIESSIEITKDIEDQLFLDAHPTIDFGRYMPDWTVSNLINYLKNFYNLKIDIDEVKQVLYLNKNEEDYLINGEATVLTKNLNIADFENIEAESYYLKFENDVDPAAYVDKNGVSYTTKPNENTIKIENKFKLIPYVSGTHQFSRAVQEKDGRGLMLYNPAVGPGTTNSVDGKLLSFDGQNGVYEASWRSWLKFRLNSGRPKASGPFTKTQLDKINETKKIWIGTTLFLVSSFDYKETESGRYWVDMDLESVTF